MPVRDTWKSLLNGSTVRRPNRRLMLLGASAAAALGVVASGIKSSLAQPSILSLKDYELTFSDEFDEPHLSLPEFQKKWYTHTPWWGDFGDAQFVDPTEGFPFTIVDGCLRIEARKDQTGKWRSGLIASVNHQQQGFTQLHGYFEIRAKLPPGLGVWPAFWLAAVVPPDSKDDGFEIDVFEYYGQFPDTYHTTTIVWPHDKSKSHGEHNVHYVPRGSLCDAFHTYGISVESDFIIQYLDGVETWRTPTPPEHKHPMMVLANLALGSGWPIKDTINPSYFDIDYIRVYRRKV